MVVFRLATAVMLFFTSFHLPVLGGEAKPVRIRIVQIIDHEALNAIERGVRDVLMSYEKGSNTPIDIASYSAQGNMATMVQIAQKVISEAPTIIVAIATPTAQVFSKVNQRAHIPTLFAAVTDPVSAKLMKNPEAPEGFITGTTDFVPMAPQLPLMRLIKQDLKAVGVIYNPGEPNAVFQVHALEEMLTKEGIKLIHAPANKTSDVRTAALSLAGQTDIIYVPTDNVAISALESIIAVSHQHKIPILDNDLAAAARGAAVAFGIDYYEAGRKTGEMIIKFLKGTPINQLPVQNPETSLVIVNQTSLEKAGGTLSAVLKTRAKSIIQ